jgi:post-segregation antitoxin (ccd killing protein)
MAARTAHGYFSRVDPKPELHMRNLPFDPRARKRTVSLTLNADLCAKAKSSGINLSKVAEEALGQVLAQCLAEQAKAAIARDLQALNALVETNESFGEMVREHYAARGDAPI